MKKWISLFIFSALSLGAQEGEPSRSLFDYQPIHIGGNVIRLGKADVTLRRGDVEDGHLYFRKSNAFLFMLLPISACSYFFPRVEWNTFTMAWNKNPKFHKKHFYYTQFALTFYSTALENWRWILRADYNMDLEHFSKPGLYGLFSGLMWGAYQIHRKWHYHVGILGYTGIEGQEVYPVIGLDYAPNKTWLFQIVFPMLYTIDYKLTKNWRFSLKGRPMKERFRTGPKEPQPRSIFSYSSTGAEFNVHYEIPMRFEMEAYVGYNFGGTFFIKNQEGHNSLYTDVGGSPYWGANLDYAF